MHSNIPSMKPIDSALVNSYRPRKCEQCGGNLFIYAHQVKVLPGIVAAQPDNLIFCIDLHVCAQCGTPLDLRKTSERSKVKPKLIKDGGQ